MITEIYKDSVSNRRSMRKSELRQITDLFFRGRCRGGAGEMQRRCSRWGGAEVQRY